MLTTKEIRPEEIALGFLVRTLQTKKQPTTRLRLSRYSLFAHLESAIKKGILQKTLDPFGIDGYTVTEEFVQQFCTARVTQAAAAIRKIDDHDKRDRYDAEHGDSRSSAGSAHRAQG